MINMMLKYFWCLSLLNAHGVFSQSPCKWNLTNLHNERKVECTEYDKKCRAEEMGQIVPDNLHKSVEKPASLFATSYLKLLSGMWDPYLNITWMPPKSATALKNLKGFLLRISTYNPQPHAFCRLFKIENGLMPHDNKATFQYIVGPVLDSATYFIMLWSLPRSGENFEMAQTIHVTTPVPTKSALSDNMDNLDLDYYEFDTDSSSAWTTSIAYRLVDNDEIQITFDFGKFGIEEFDVKLIKKEQLVKGAYAYSKTVKKSQSHDPNHGIVSFHNVEAGTYVVQVTPLDSFKSHPGRCLCFTMEDGNRECETCSNSQTDLFNVTGKSKGGKSNEVKIPPTTELEEGINLSKAIAPKENIQNSHEMVVIVLVFFVCIIVFGSLSMVVWKARRSGSNQNPTQGQPAIEMGALSQDSADNRKSILVLSADDHYHHLEVVKDLLNILDQYCKFNVIYPPRQINQICQINWTNWIVKCLDKVDFVILVTSEAAARLMQASLRHETFNIQQLTETGHLYVPMLQQVLKASSKELTMDKYITVSFSYTPREFTTIPGLPTPHHFTLVEGLQEFLCYMKDLNGSLARVTACDENNLTNLKYSVIRAARFESCHVHWFTERFGNSYQRSYNRLDSGYHSVAPSRLNNISESSSPENQLEKDDEKDELGFYPPEEEFEQVVLYNIPPDDSGADCMRLSVSTQLRQINDNYENSAH